MLCWVVTGGMDWVGMGWGGVGLGGVWIGIGVRLGSLWRGWVEWDEDGVGEMGWDGVGSDA